MRTVDAPTEVNARAVVLVEGLSDRSALEALAERYGRTLTAEGVVVLAMGGASNVGHFLDRYGPRGRDLRLAGLYDEAEVGYFRRGLERAGLLPRFEESRADLVRSAPARAQMEAHGFYVCVSDLEDELIRALGTEGVERVIEAQGELNSFRRFQAMPQHRGTPVHRQLHRFLGTRATRKIRCAQRLVEALDIGRLPPPLVQLAARLRAGLNCASPG